MAIAADQPHANQSVGRYGALRLREACSRQGDAGSDGRLQESPPVNRNRWQVSAGAGGVIFHGIIWETSNSPVIKRECNATAKGIQATEEEYSNVLALPVKQFKNVTFG
jgi:hypothetical protein